VGKKKSRKKVDQYFPVHFTPPAMSEKVSSSFADPWKVGSEEEKNEGKAGGFPIATVDHRRG